MQETEKDQWYLDKIEIEFNRFGDNQGKYTGRIRFQNGEFESFSFKIRPDMAQPYINLMSKDIVSAASNLADRLVESLGLPRENTTEEQ